MSFKILEVTKDLRSDSEVIYCKSSIGKYLEIIGEDFEEFELQRKKESHKGYLRLKKDISEGALLPPITLAIKPHKVQEIKKLLANKDELEVALSNAYVVDILDGLQRTHIIYDLKKEGVVFDENQELLLEYWVEEDIGKLIYRMIILNSGQKAMSLRHQVELLFVSLKETIITEIEGIELLKEREGLRRSSSNKYSLGDVASAYQAFMTVSTELDKSKIISVGLESASVFDSSEEELTEQYSQFIKYFKVFKEIDNLAWVHYKLDKYKLSVDSEARVLELKAVKKPTTDESKELVRLLAFKNANLWLGKDNVMMGVFCAISTFLGSNKHERVSKSLEELINSFSDDDYDPLGILQYELNKSDINPRKSNVGFATRRLILNGFKEYFRADGDTPMSQCWDLAVD